jgi:hypothetical protein
LTEHRRRGTLEKGKKRYSPKSVEEIEVAAAAEHEVHGERGELKRKAVS